MGYFYKFKVIFFAILLIGAMQASVNGMQNKLSNDVAKFNKMDLRYCCVIILSIIDEDSELSKYFTDSAVTRMRDLAYSKVLPNVIKCFRDVDKQFSDMKKICTTHDRFVPLLFSFIYRLKKIQIQICVDNDITQCEQEITMQQCELEKCIRNSKSKPKQFNAIEKLQNNIDNLRVELGELVREMQGVCDKLRNQQNTKKESVSYNNNIIELERKVRSKEDEIKASDKILEDKMNTLISQDSQNDAYKQIIQCRQSINKLHKAKEIFLKDRKLWEENFSVANNLYFATNHYNQSQRYIYEIFIDCMQAMQKIVKSIDDVESLEMIHDSYCDMNEYKTTISSDVSSHIKKLKEQQQQSQQQKQN